jgi:hypothetical protein
MGIPQKYLRRMATEAPELLARNVNHWFAHKPERRMIRTLGADARAFLSDTYRPLDNYDLLGAVVPRLGEAGCEIKSSEVTERRLYIQAVTPRLTEEVKVGDVVQAGVVISNSEVGCGAINVEEFIWRLSCANGLVLGSAIRRCHLGRSGEVDDSTYELLSSQTRQLDDKAFWAKVNDVVAAVLSGERFLQNVGKLRQAATQPLGSPLAVVEVAAERLGLADEEKDAVLRHLVNGGDLTQWGLMNAVTRTAQDVAEYDRGIELERMGGRVLELPASDWTNHLLSRVGE